MVAKSNEMNSQNPEVNSEMYSFNPRKAFDLSALPLMFRELIWVEIRTNFFNKLVALGTAILEKKGIGKEEVELFCRLLSMKWGEAIAAHPYDQRFESPEKMQAVYRSNIWVYLFRMQETQWGVTEEEDPQSIFPILLHNLSYLIKECCLEYQKNKSINYTSYLEPWSRFLHSTLLVPSEFSYFCVQRISSESEEKKEGRIDPFLGEVLFAGLLDPKFFLDVAPRLLTWIYNVDPSIVVTHSNFDAVYKSAQLGPFLPYESVKSFVDELECGDDVVLTQEVTTLKELMRDASKEEKEEKEKQEKQEKNVTPQIFSAIDTLYKKRWDRIEGTEKDYLLCPEHPENIGWIKLAKTLMGMGFSESYFQILLPGLDHGRDAKTGKLLGRDPETGEFLSRDPNTGERLGPIGEFLGRDPLTGQLLGAYPPNFYLRLKDGDLLFLPTLIYDPSTGKPRKKIINYNRKDEEVELTREELEWIKKQGSPKIVFELEEQCPRFAQVATVSMATILEVLAIIKAIAYPDSYEQFLIRLGRDSTKERVLQFFDYVNTLSAQEHSAFMHHVVPLENELCTVEGVLKKMKAEMKSYDELDDVPRLKNRKELRDQLKINCLKRCKALAENFMPLLYDYFYKYQDFDPLFIAPAEIKKLQEGSKKKVFIDVCELSLQEIERRLLKMIVFALTYDFGWIWPGTARTIGLPSDVESAKPVEEYQNRVPLHVRQLYGEICYSLRRGSCNNVAFGQMLMLIKLHCHYKRLEQRRGCPAMLSEYYTSEFLFYRALSNPSFFTDIKLHLTASPSQIFIILSELCLKKSPVKKGVPIVKIEMHSVFDKFLENLLTIFNQQRVLALTNQEVWLRVNILFLRFFKKLPEQEQKEVLDLYQLPAEISRDAFFKSVLAFLVYRLAKLSALETTHYLQAFFVPQTVNPKKFQETWRTLTDQTQDISLEGLTSLKDFYERIMPDLETVFSKLPEKMRQSLSFLEEHLKNASCVYQMAPCVHQM